MPKKIVGAIPPPPDIDPDMDLHGYSSDDSNESIWERLRFLLLGTVGLAALFGLSFF